MAQWSAAEQLMLELMNRARLDPQGEADRYGIALNKDLAAGTITAAPKQVLAPNDLLNDAARAHSQWMLDVDIFAHKGAGGSSPGERMEAAGYTFNGASGWGENIAWRGTTGSFVAADYILAQHRGLFLSADHRENLLEDFFQEAGVGALEGRFRDDGTTYNALMTSQNFARSGSDVFVTGVAYDDADLDDFYSVGEARAGVAVSTAAGASTTTAGAGGYALADSSSAVVVTFSSGGLAAAITATVDTSAGNVKLDLVDGARLETSAPSMALGANAMAAALLGIHDGDLTGNGLANRLEGNSGDNTLTGAGGKDTLIGATGSDDLLGGGGGDRLFGGGGNDRLFGQDGWDRLFGNDGDDVLNGGKGRDSLEGGNGDDSLYGGESNDELHGDGGADRISGNAGLDLLYGGGGSDRIWGGSGHDTIIGGGGADSLYGGSGSDHLSGNAGADLLNGGRGDDHFLPGAGADTMWGGGGRDRFFFDEWPEGSSVDTIGDFVVGEDVIVLDHETYEGLALGEGLSGEVFHIGQAAADGDDRIIYDSATGALYFDADGLGGSVQVQFAALTANLLLAASDFDVV